MADRGLVTREAWDVGHASREVGDIVGLALPVVPCSTSASVDRVALWLGPDEWLVVAEKMPDDEARAIWQNTKAYPKWQDAIKRMPGWSKPAGKPARVTFTVVKTPKSTRFDDLTLDNQGGLAKGSIERGWLDKHESGTCVKFTQAGADLFA